MDAWPWLIALVLVSPVLAGCLGGENVAPSAVDDPTGEIRLEDVPAGATLEEIDEGVRLVWEAMPLPFERTIEIPANATLVRATSEVEADETLFVHLENADTNRRRCNVPWVTAWDTPRTGSMTCSGLTAVDPPGAKWTIEVAGPAEADLVAVEFLQTPVEGPAAELDLSKLSMPTHDVTEPEAVRISSHDGAELYAQVTLPAGEGPWPVILASSPYNGGYHATGQPAMWGYFVHDWAKRGYAVVMADVRGTGYSGGCMEVWGPNETQDQRVLVEWAAQQAWSNGDIGFYGQSYVGTTPVEAAVQAPEALKAIIAVAPVNNAYDDWHFGGVPNGENWLSPLVGYQLGVGTLDKAAMLVGEGDPAATAIRAANGVCDPTLTARANDPRAIYDDYYEVRNFTARAGEVKAATLYTHGFQDPNVKSQMATHWFNPIDAPKLGVFGHWIHQHPPRADNEVLFLAWMDQYVKGKAMGFEDVPPVTVTTNDGEHRTGETWPPTDAIERSLYPDFAADELTTSPGDGAETIVLDPSGLTGDAAGPSAHAVRLTGTLAERLHLAGQATLDLTVTLDGGDNAHVAAFLYDGVGPDSELVTFGMANLAHRDGHDTYQPVQPGERVRMQLPFLPTEHTFSAGDEIELVIRAAQPDDWAAVDPGRPGTLTIHAGERGTDLDLPVLLDPATEPVPVAVQP